jgi:hypothetical protein
MLATTATGWRAQAQGFEGTVSMVMNMGGEPIPVDYALKGHKARLELQMASRTNTVIIDLDARTQTILIPEVKAYAVHSGDAPSQIANASPIKVTDLGTTETVAGHSCEDYRLDTDKYAGSACMTKEFGENPLTDTLNGPLGHALKGDETLKKAGMPLKLSITFKEGAHKDEKTTMEVTKVVPGPVDAAQFEIPDGWRKLNGLPGLP